MTKTFSWVIVILLLQPMLLVVSVPFAFAQTTTPPITLTPPDDQNPTALDIFNRAPDPETGQKGYEYPGRSYTLQDPQLSDVPFLIEHAIKFFLGIVGAVTLFFFSAGAFEYIWMIEIEKKQEGKQRMVYAVIGLVIVLLSYLIVDVVVRVIF